MAAYRQWHTKHAGFPSDAWSEENKKFPIAIIDVGTRDGPLLHEQLAERVAWIPLENIRDPSKASHSTEVAGIISAKSDKGISGCCAAYVQVYNVFNTAGFSYDAFFEALGKVRNSVPKPLVLNLSISFEPNPPLLARLKDEMRQCIEANIVVVASVGDHAKGKASNVERWPAAVSSDVIAVGATNLADQRYFYSSTGKHLAMSAPGEDIWTLYGTNGYRWASGTSYAAAVATSAIWLARRQNPKVSARDFINTLRHALETSPHDPDTGYRVLSKNDLSVEGLLKLIPPLSV